ncbi:MAG: polysaccharide deacetylase family protein [Firmicutes bacterium]|nr:polysaccharide deacetylase family protein [Bacillota bacterium]
MKKFLKLGFIIGIASILICGVIATNQTAFYVDATSTKAISWGLKPNTKEMTPTPPDGSAELLAKYDGMFVGDTSKKEIYLTFDLGYEAGYTAAVLDILKKHNARAIFFLCGNYLKEEELVNRMINEGHTIGNHTNHHKDPTKLNDDGIRKDIIDFKTKFDEKYNANREKKIAMKHYRPPSGKFNERTLAIAKEEGLRTVMWSGAIVDWFKKPIDPIKSSDKVISRIHPGAIMLFHIANSGMPKMLDIMIPQLIEKGYSIGDAGEL